MDSDNDSIYGHCVVGKCAKVCTGFSPGATRGQYCASCSCVREFHQREDTGSDKENAEEVGSDQGDTDGTEGEDDSEEQAKSKGKGKATYRKEGLSQSKLSQASSSKSGRVKNRLQLATSKFAGKTSALKPTVGSGGSSKPLKKNTMPTARRTVKIEGKRKTSALKLNPTRKTSGPTPSPIRELGHFYLVCDAMDHELTEEHGSLSEGMVLMARNQFNRANLAAHGLKQGKASGMQLDENWTVSELHDFIISRYPRIFAWVMKNLPPGHRGYPWILLVANGHELHQSLRSEATLDMEFIWDVVYKNGKAYGKSELFIGTAITVPLDVVKKLVILPETHLNAPGTGSDSESTITGQEPATPNNSGGRRTCNRLNGRPPSILMNTDSPPRKRKRPDPKVLKEETTENSDVEAKVELKRKQRSLSIEVVTPKRIKKEIELVDLTEDTPERLKFEPAAFDNFTFTDVHRSPTPPTFNNLFEDRTRFSKNPWITLAKNDVELDF